MLMLGNIIKIVCWPIGFIIMAHAWGKTFLLGELVWASSYLTLLHVGWRYVGINAAGYAFLGSYLIYLMVLYVVTSQASGFGWTRENLGLTLGLFVTAVSLLVVLSRYALAGYVFGGLATVAFVLFSVRRLYGMVENVRVKRIGQFFRM